MAFQENNQNHASLKYLPQGFSILFYGREFNFKVIGGIIDKRNVQIKGNFNSDEFGKDSFLNFSSEEKTSYILGAKQEM